MSKNISKLSNNQLTITRHVLEQNIGKLLDFGIVKYGIHEKNHGCKCVQVKIEVGHPDQIKLDKFLTQFNVSTVEIKQKLNSTICIFELHKNTIRNLFSDLYDDVMPSTGDYLNDSTILKDGRIQMLIFKLNNSDQIEYKVCSGALHKYCVDNIEAIDQAVYLDRKTFIWIVEGTGCVCSSFEPLPASLIDKAELLKAILEIQ